MQRGGSTVLSLAQRRVCVKCVVDLVCHNCEGVFRGGRADLISGCCSTAVFARAPRARHYSEAARVSEINIHHATRHTHTSDV